MSDEIKVKNSCYCGSNEVKHTSYEGKNFDQLADEWGVTCSNCGVERMTLLDLATLRLVGEASQSALKKRRGGSNGG